MPAQTTEFAFETTVGEILLGHAGWHPGSLGEWDVEQALFPACVCALIAETQPKLWADMRTLHGVGLEQLIVDALVKELDLKGTLHVLRHGFKFYGKTFRLAYFKPAHGLNEEVLRALRAEPADGDPPGALPPRQAATRWTCCSRSTACRSRHAS